MSIPAKILIVGPSWVGDMVMAQTLFKILRQQYPDAIMDVLAPDWSRPLLERMPEIRRAIAMPLGHGELGLKIRYQLGKELRSEGYDQAIVLPNSWKSAIVPWAAKIPVRTGWRGEMRWGLLNDARVLDKARYSLMIQRFAALAFERDAVLPAELPWPQLEIDPAHVQASLETFNLKSDKPILVLCPGAEFGPAKRWPSAHYAKLATAYFEKDWQVWVFGSPKDQAVAAEIQQHVKQPLTDLTGKTSLGEAIDLMSLGHAVVSNDSGLMHIAAAVQRKLVVMYGSSSAGFTPPLSQDVKTLTLDLDCSPCFQRECPLGHLDCLTKLPAQQVSAALDELLCAS